jgi:ATP-dependent Clp protease, protease subunit
VERDLERDYYMSAEEALEYGLIDKILKRGKNGEVAQK